MDGCPPGKHVDHKCRLQNKCPHFEVGVFFSASADSVHGPGMTAIGARRPSAELLEFPPLRRSIRHPLAVALAHPGAWMARWSSCPLGL